MAKLDMALVCVVAKIAMAIWAINRRGFDEDKDVRKKRAVQAIHFQTYF